MMKRLLLVLLLASGLPAGAAVTVTHAIATASTTNAATYTSGSFTPVAGDLLVVFVTSSGTVGAGTMTDTQSLGWTKITSAVKNTSADTIYCFVANAPAAAVATTVTFGTGGAAATGAFIDVARVAGMTRTGAAAVRQSAIQSNGAAAATPAPTFGSAVLTGNPTLGVIGNGTSPATMTAPASWTEMDDSTGYATPTTGQEYVSRVSGFTGTTITWGSTSASAFGSIIIELDSTTAPFTAPVTGQFCYGSATSGTTFSCSFTNNPTSGNLVVVSLLTFTGLTTGAGSVVDSAGTPNVYATPVCSATNDATAGKACLSYFVANGTANKTITVTVTGGTCGACSIRADEFAVSGGTVSLDGSVQTGSGSTQAITAPTVTPAGSAELLIGMCADANQCGATGSSWSKEVNSPGSFFEGTEYILSASAGTAVSFAGLSAVAWDSVGAAFKITAPGGTVVPKLAIMGVGN
jgi:hypothetical protein